jgi:hypothetical protein
MTVKMFTLQLMFGKIIFSIFSPHLSLPTYHIILLAAVRKMETKEVTYCTCYITETLKSVPVSKLLTFRPLMYTTYRPTADINYIKKKI